MQNIDFTSPKTLFIATNELEILLSELFNNILNPNISNPEIVNLNLYHIFKLDLNPNNSSVLLYNIIYRIYGKSIFEISNKINYNTIYSTHYIDLLNMFHHNSNLSNNSKNVFIFNNYIPDIVNNNVYNIIIHDKLSIPDSILNNINYIMYNCDIIELDEEYRPFKRQKISNTEFEDKYRIFEMHNTIFYQKNAKDNTKMYEESQNPYII